MEKTPSTHLPISAVMLVSLLLVIGLTPILSDHTQGTDMEVFPSRMEVHSQELDEDQHTFVENILVEWELVSDEEGNTIVLYGSSFTAGDQGQNLQYITRDIIVNGDIESIEVKFGDPVLVKAGPGHYNVPGVVGYWDGEVHPSWKGGLTNDVLHGYEVVDLGIQAPSFERTRTFSLRIYPLDHYTDGTTLVYTNIRLSYSVLPNPDDLHGSAPFSTGKTLGNVSYLIITHEDLASSLQDLVEWKSQKGVFTILATTKEIDSMYNKKDIQAEMRAFVQDMEAVHDIDYLLLVGDVNLVKTRNTLNLYPYTSLGEPTTFASDSYFGCVDEGTSWNRDGDSTYAESGELDDAIPDLAVGRIASNDKDLISDLVQHLIEREQGFQWDDEMKKAIFIAGNPDTVPGYPPDTLDHFWNTYAKDVFEDRETIYYDGLGTMPFSSNSFRSTIGNKYQAACYFSHGSQTSLPGLFSNAQVSTMDGNGPEGSFFTMACLTGYFDSSTTECFAEALTETKDRGVLGYIGSSRLAVGEIDLVYSGDAPGLEEDYWRAVKKAGEGDLKPTVGDIYREAVTHFSSTFYPFPTDYYGYSAQRTFLEYNLFGEPEAPLFFRPPEQLVLEYEVLNDNGTIWAKVTNMTGAPVEGASVTLYRYLELGVSELTNSSGEVVFDIPPSNGGIVNLTAHRAGDLPVNHTIELPDELYPTPLYTIDPPEPDGFEGIYISKPTVDLFGDETVDIEYRINGGEMYIRSHHVTLEATEGSQNIEFRVIDAVGHISDWLDFNFTVDTTPPEIWTTTDPSAPNGNDGWFSTPIRIGVNSSEELAIAYYRIDDSIERMYEEPVWLYNGVYEVNFRAYDMAGNMNITSTTIKIDTNLPYSTLDVSHEPDGDNGYYVTLPAILIRAYDENGATPQYRWDNSSWQEVEGTIYPPKGAHRLEYRAIDTIGNIENGLNFQWFMYDPDPPILACNISPENPDGENDIYVSKPTVEMFVRQSEISDVEIRYFLGETNQGFNWLNDSLLYIGPILIPEGEWRLHMMARDIAGNQHFPVPLDITVDVTKPEMIFNITPGEPDGENMWYITQPVISVHSDQGSRVYISMDENETWMEISDIITLPPGRHSVSLKTLDRAGNTAYSGPFLYKYDDQDPVSVISVDRYTYYLDEIINLSAMGSSDENGPLLYMFNTSDDRTSLWVDEVNWTITFNQTGNFSVRLMVMDNSGRSSLSRDITIQIIERPPPPPEEDNLIVEPFDPAPLDQKSWTDASLEEKRFVRGGIIVILLLIIAILMLLVVRKVRVKEVEWEGDDDWLDEDWVDIDIDEEPVFEPDVIIFE
ncbi:MAG: C25 family cysteine peptidase [Thermoplasmatota archaeon]